jgi:hypothetical protein
MHEEDEMRTAAGSVGIWKKGSKTIVTMKTMTSGKEELYLDEMTDFRRSIINTMYRSERVIIN